jgi:hypothetical protein
LIRLAIQETNWSNEPEDAMEQQQLSGIDASVLYLETPETPMHVAG